MLPNAGELMNARSPVCLDADGYRITRFVYDEATATVEIVYQSAKDNDRVYYVFHGLQLDQLSPIVSPASLTVLNARLCQHEVPRDLRIAEGEEDGHLGSVLFWAGRVERVA